MRAINYKTTMSKIVMKSQSMKTMMMRKCLKILTSKKRFNYFTKTDKEIHNIFGEPQEWSIMIM